jgi:hypothetical protein
MRVGTGGQQQTEKSRRTMPACAVPWLLLALLAGCAAPPPKVAPAMIAGNTAVTMRG